MLMPWKHRVNFAVEVFPDMGTMGSQELPPFEFLFICETHFMLYGCT